MPLCRSVALVFLMTLVLGVVGESFRQKRAGALVYNSGGVLRFVSLLGIPVAGSNQPFILLVTSFQFVFTMPRNATQFQPQLEEKRRSVSQGITRALVYRALEQSMDRRGVNGTACVLRTICEVAETPLQHNGLIGELVQLFFTPSTDESDVYVDAWRHGVGGDDCQHRFSSCRKGEGILDLISMIDS